MGTGGLKQLQFFQDSLALSVVLQVARVHGLAGTNNENAEKSRKEIADKMSLKIYISYDSLRNRGDFSKNKRIFRERCIMYERSFNKALTNTTNKR